MSFICLLLACAFDMILISYDIIDEHTLEFNITTRAFIEHSVFLKKRSQVLTFFMFYFKTQCFYLRIAKETVILLVFWNVLNIM